MPLPPEITISAEVSSGLSETVSSFLTKSDFLEPVSGTSLSSTDAVLPETETLSNDVVLIVNAFFSCEDCTVAMHEPAYIGFLNVLSSIISVTSEIC